MKPAPNAASALALRRSAAASTMIVMAASALSAVLGFGREIINAHFYGTSSELDAFVNASTIPIVLFGIFNGSLVGALVPIFSEYTSNGNEEELRRLGSTVINAVAIILVVLAALGWLLAPILVPVVAHGFPPAKQELEVRMVRLLMPGIIATSLSGVFAALLNANHRFVASSLVNVAANVVTIALVVVLQREFGIFALVLGSVIGVFAQLLVQLPSILRYRLYRFEMHLRHPGLAKAWALFIPVTIGSGAWQVNLACDRYFASTLSAGSTAGLGYTTKLAFLPIMIVAGAVGTVIFPVIAGQFAASDKVGMRRSISLSLRMVTFVVLPSAAGLITLAYPIVETLFERGAFGPGSTSFCASLVPFACVPLIAISYNTVMARACYACKEMRLAVTSSFFVIAINIALSAMLIHFLGARGLLLANGLAMFFGTVFLVVVLWRLSGGLEWRPMVRSISRVALASVIMGTALYFVQALRFVSAISLWPRIPFLLLLLTVGAVVYVGASRALGIEELTLVFKAIMRKTGRAAAGTTLSSRSGDA